MVAERNNIFARVDFTGAIIFAEPTRSVWFPHEEQDLASVVAVIESVKDIPEEDKKLLWFTRSDYHFSRSSARVIAKESERYGHSKRLDNAYVTEFDQEAQDRLHLWALHGSSRRGLERWANSTHGDQRKDDQRTYIRGVLRTQTEMRLRGADRQFMEQRIREVGHTLSRRSRFFAQMIASADAQAAKWEFGITDVSVPAISPRQIMKQIASKNLGLGGRQQRRSGRRVSDVPSVPNLLGGVAKSARTESAAAGPASRRRSSAHSITSPRIQIRTRPARISRMA